MFKKVITLLLFFIIIPTSGICSDFNFAGIDWSDSPNQVLNKLVDKGIVNTNISNEGPTFMTGTGDDGKPMKIDLENVISRMVDRSKWNSLKEGCTIDSTLRDEIGSSNKIKIMGVGALPESIIRGAKFSFTYDTNQLLAYNVRLSKNANAVEFKEMLVSKYGSPEEKSNVYVWKNNGQSIYFYNPTQSIAEMYYLNDHKIDDFIKTIREAEYVINSKKTKTESEEAKKLF